MNINWQNPLLGGVLIGISVSLMLLWNGRVTGISGIINGALVPKKNDFFWRIYFLLGLFIGGLFSQKFISNSFPNTTQSNIGLFIFSGFLVGLGTVMGGGCTSGHGICGISRLSIRSILATSLFIISGILTVTLIKKLGLL